MITLLLVLLGAGLALSVPPMIVSDGAGLAGSHCLCDRSMGKRLRYPCPGIHNRDGYDLFSAGTDDKPDTADDDWGEQAKD